MKDIYEKFKKNLKAVAVAGLASLVFTECDKKIITDYNLFCEDAIISEISYLPPRTGTPFFNSGPGREIVVKNNEGNKFILHKYTNHDPFNEGDSVNVAYLEINQNTYSKNGELLKIDPIRKLPMDLFLENCN